jgi:hypothetical protein
VTDYDSAALANRLDDSYQGAEFNAVSQTVDARALHAAKSRSSAVAPGLSDQPAGVLPRASAASVAVEPSLGGDASLPDQTTMRGQYQRGPLAMLSDAAVRSHYDSNIKPAPPKTYVDEKFLIPSRELQIGDKIGEGAYGEFACKRGTARARARVCVCVCVCEDLHHSHRRHCVQSKVEGCQCRRETGQR